MPDKAKDDKKIILPYRGIIDNWYYSIDQTNGHLSVVGMSRDIPETIRGQRIQINCRDNDLHTRGVRSGHVFDGFYYRYKLGIEHMRGGRYRLGFERGAV